MMELEEYWKSVSIAEPFLGLLGIVPESLAPEHVILRLPVREELTNHGHFLHAGVQYTLGEVAATTAAAMLFRDIVPPVTIVTATATVTYQRPSRGAGDMIALVERSTLEGQQLREAFAAQRRVRVRSHVQLTDGGETTVTPEPITVMTVESVVRATGQ